MYTKKLSDMKTRTKLSKINKEFCFSDHLCGQVPREFQEIDVLANITGETENEHAHLICSHVAVVRPNSPDNNNLASNYNTKVNCDGHERNGEGDCHRPNNFSENTDIIVMNPDANEKQYYREAKKQKSNKLGCKSGGLKRVSFGSSKGSMVETLVFEAPTPLIEHLEINSDTKCDDTCKPTSTLDDSGIDTQEELERSVLRVSIYQSNQPQQVCPPEYFTKFDDNFENTFDNCNYNLEDTMTTVTTMAAYDRQLSTDSGWDNPFRPGGDLSREADEIVNMIRGGKPITPTEDSSLRNGETQFGDICINSIAGENVTKTNVTQNQSAQNGTNSHRPQPAKPAVTKAAENNGVTSLAQVSKQVVPGPNSASHVVIDEKKKKKGCCTIQ